MIIVIYGLCYVRLYVDSRAGCARAGPASRRPALPGETTVITITDNNNDNNDIINTMTIVLLMMNIITMIIMIVIIITITIMTVIVNLVMKLTSNAAPSAR